MIASRAATARTDQRPINILAGQDLELYEPVLSKPRTYENEAIVAHVPACPDPPHLLRQRKTYPPIMRRALETYTPIFRRRSGIYTRRRLCRDARSKSVGTAEARRVELRDKSG